MGWGEPIIKFNSFKASLDLHLEQGKGKKLVVLLYSDNNLGSLEYNYYP